MFACSHKVVQLILLHNSFQEPGKSYLFFVYLSIFLCMNVYPHLCIVYLKFDTICSDINMNNVVRTSTHHFLKICISKVCCIFKSNSQLKTKCVQCSGTAFSLTLSVETKNEDLLLQMLIYIQTNIHLHLWWNVSFYKQKSCLCAFVPFECYDNLLSSTKYSVYREFILVRSITFSAMRGVNKHKYWRFRCLFPFNYPFP